MTKIFKNQSLRKINLFGLLFVIVLFSLFIFSVLYNSYYQYKKDIEILEIEYVKSQKKFIELETKRALKYIEYKYKKESHKPKDVLQAEITEVIEKMRNEGDGTGYIFIYTFDGVNIADPILKENSGKNLLNFTDLDGKKVIYELIKISQQPNGGYVNYVWNKPTTNQPSPKISYAISYKPLGWMLGSGVYLDDIKEIIEAKKEEHLNKIFQYLFSTILIVIVIFVLGFVIYRYFMSIIEDDIQLIRQSSLDLNLIEVNNIAFKEFKEVANHINVMNENLQDLNKNLEQKVQKRTLELEKAKEYALSIVQKQDRFIKDAIHEINTPLGIIIINIDLYNLKYGKNKYLGKIEAGAKIIHNIYNDLEYMIKKDRIEYPKQELNFTSFMKERVEFFSEIAIGNELNFKLDIENNIFTNINPIHLQRIIDNTFSNAIKYSFSHKNIKVKLYKNDDFKILEVSNYGKPILNPEKLFKRYYREDNSRGGFGIGLSIIKEICDKNNVEIKVISNDGLVTFRYYFI